MIYRFADCELDTDTLELIRAGGRQHVEPQVFAVLVHLARHCDRVVSRDELLDEVWGHRFVTDATLSSRVKAARRAIGDSGEEQRIIRTLRGRGFRLVVSVDELPPEVAAAADGGASSGLVGRAGELGVLRAELTAVLAARRRVVLVSGEAGIGKTALLEAFLHAAASTPGVRVALGSCVEHRGAGEPYLPLLDALARLASGPARAPCPDVAGWAALAGGRRGAQ
jgi:DNA-binding winged helix-turn-helix (wHTH) protein